MNTSTNNKNEYIISDIEQYRILNICKRLKNSVTSLDIINWLRNFKMYEKDKALTVLEKLEYITESEIIELYDEKLEDILVQNANKKVIIHPVSEYGKSGTLMSYYLKKTPSYKNNKEGITFFPHYDNFKHKLKNYRTETAVIFIDDFSGSGNQFNNYYKTYIKPQISTNKYIVSLSFLTMFYLPSAKSSIEKNNPEIKIIGNIKYPVFLTDRSVFGSRKNMLPIREFCHSYGKDLFSTYDKATNTNHIHPLGYDKSQALIVFAYNPPNNTLPIIWSSKKWHPLFPRVPEHRISTSKKIRKELAHQIGLLSDSDISHYFTSGKKDIGWKSINFITKTDFIIYSIIRLLKQKRPIPVICQILGLTEKDYIEFVQSKTEIFSSLNELTEHGQNLYIEIRKQLKLVKKDIRSSSNDYEIKRTKYLPKNFKGEL
jgi:hypothetical protein